MYSKKKKNKSIIAGLNFSSERTLVPRHFLGTNYPFHHRFGYYTPNPAHGSNSDTRLDLVLRVRKEEAEVTARCVRGFIFRMIYITMSLLSQWFVPPINPSNRLHRATLFINDCGMLEHQNYSYYLNIHLDKWIFSNGRNGICHLPWFLKSTRGKNILVPLFYCSIIFIAVYKYESNISFRNFWK